MLRTPYPKPNSLALSLDNPINNIQGTIPMRGEQQVYHLKVHAPGRIVLPAEARQRNHIAEGDTVIITEDA